MPTCSAAATHDFTAAVSCRILRWSTGVNDMTSVLNHYYGSGFTYQQDDQAKLRERLVDACQQLSVHRKIWKRDCHMVLWVCRLAEQGGENRLRHPVPRLSRWIGTLTLSRLGTSLIHLGRIALHLHDQYLLFTPRTDVGARLAGLGVSDGLDRPAMAGEVQGQGVHDITLPRPWLGRS